MIIKSTIKNKTQNTFKGRENTDLRGKKKRKWIHANFYTKTIQVKFWCLITGIKLR